MARHHISFTVNGDPVEVLCDTEQTLLDVLRDELELTGTKEGCGTGDCGACSVTVDGRLVCSCLMLGVEAQGKRVETIEGMANPDGSLGVIQQAFQDNHGLQCGFCTPGMVMSAADLLKRNTNPSEHEIREWLEGNFCRCTGYHNIVKSIQAAAANMGGGRVAAE